MQAERQVPVLAQDEAEALWAELVAAGEGRTETREEPTPRDAGCWEL